MIFKVPFQTKAFYDIKNGKFTNTGNVDAEGSWEEQPDMGSAVHVLVVRVSFNLI